MATLKQWKDWNFPNRGRFNDWSKLTIDTINSIKAKPGVYLLAIPLEKGSLKTISLGRFLATDPHGLIDIGEAQNVKQRIKTLFACATEEGTTGHMAGWRLKNLNILDRIGHQAEELLISWYYLKNKNEAYEWEGWLLKEYFELFGELPPLNYKFNWSSFIDKE